jgi:uncharacterized protein YmfQ (DUF2313 family)
VTSFFDFGFETTSPPGPPVYTPDPDLEDVADRFQAAAIALLPPGRALSKETDSDLGILIKALMVEFARAQLEADTLYRNTIPSQAVEYLSDWETALGLPDVPNPPVTDAERQGAVVAKLLGRKGHSQATYEEAAAALGYDDIEFERFGPFEVGSSAVGDELSTDEWSHVVRVHVLVGDQTADESLISVFVNQLRRAHGYLDIILEGPMGAVRNHIVNYFNATSLGASVDGAAVEVRYAGHLSILADITNGSGGAPSDTPAGDFVLQVSTDGVNWITDTEATVTTELNKIKPNGNNQVHAVAKLTNVGGHYARFRYVRTSGGGTNAKVTAHVSAW